MAARRPSPPTTPQLLERPDADQPPARLPTRHERTNQTDSPDNRLLLTVQEAAKRLSLGRSLMYELIRNGEVASVHVGRLRRISTDALSTYVASLHDRNRDREPT